MILMEFPRRVYAFEQTPQKTTTQKTKPLNEKEDPRLVGKRNINKGQLDFYSPEKEVAIGRQVAAEIEKQAKFVDDPIITEYINRLGHNLVLNSDAKISFTFKLIASDDVNAFALPGGFLFINRGLILAADNEAEIVSVIAHEIGHVCARHGMEQATRGQLVQILTIPLIITGAGGVFARQAAQIGVPAAMLRFSRNAEKEADMLGAEYAWASGYDPFALITFFEKLEKQNKRKPNLISKLFTDHPPTIDRIELMRDLLARFPDRDEYVIDSSEFKHIKNRLLGTIGMRVVDRDRDTGPKRPTLKRRGDQQQKPEDPSEGEKREGKEKPTLKRKDSSGKPPIN